MKITAILKKVTLIVCAIAMLSTLLVGCGNGSKEKIVIYSSNEDYQIEFMKERLKKQFPDYDIVFQYKSSGEHAASLKATGTKTDADISIDIEYGYAAQIAKLGYFADLTVTNLVKDRLNARKPEIASGLQSGRTAAKRALSKMLENMDKFD